MKCNAALKTFLLVSMIALGGCSGVPNGGNNPPPSQNANLAVTMTSTPSVSLTNISVISATVGITGITFTPSTGSAVALTLTPTVYPVDLNKLQSDSAFLGSLSIPADTYTSATVTFSAPVLTILNETGGTLNTNCLSGTICQITLTAGSAQVSTAPFPLTLTAAQNTGVSLNVNLENALTVTNNVLALNFSGVGVFTAAALPRTGAPSGSLDLIEDFVGTVTAKGSTSLTVTAANGTTLVMTLPASPVIEDPQGLCPALNATCLVVNQTIVSVDATVGTTGALTVTSADLLDAAPTNEVEGTLLANGTPGQFFLVVSNKVLGGTANATLAAAATGDIFLVTLNNPTFIVDTDEFFNNASLPSSAVTTLFTSEADFRDGQDVMVHVTAATGTAANGNQDLTADVVRLRFTRTTGTVQSVSGTAISLGNLPPFLPFTTNPLAQTITDATNFDNVTDVNSLNAGDKVSIRALLLNNSAFSFYAPKVRRQP